MNNDRKLAMTLETLINGGRGTGMAYRGHKIFRNFDDGGYAITVHEGGATHRVVGKGATISECIKHIDQMGDFVNGAYQTDPE